MRKLLVIGRGAREHALAHKALLSGKLEVYVAPGNGGMQPPIQRVLIQENQIRELREFIRQHRIEYVIVGPEVPLARGMYDDLHDLATVIGPSQRLTFLEASKARAKAFLREAGIPTAEAVIFDATQVDAAEAHLRKVSYPVVVKASGLAGGKGVLVAQTPEEAIAFAKGCLSGEKFGSAGSTILIEQFLQGEERSIFLLADGKGYTILPSARDYKRLSEGDQGPNTGGMGGYAPADTPEWIDQVRRKVIDPTLERLQQMGIPYHGFLYLGLMKVGDEPYVLEYNVRLGDPEAQIILPLIDNTLDEILFYYKIQRLSELKVRMHATSAVAVVAATPGYPDASTSGHFIPMPALSEGGCRLQGDSYIYWAGVEVSEEGQVFTLGGRVYTAVGLGKDRAEARSRAYAALEQVNFPEKVFRRDIAA
ncbi:MAG: phosphoribosylamine--glycine ligase [Bacteroidia bacterium]|nr:phosphoribosylamine--glycine ligase [Bacteroidia bacterium]MDW8235891.1 phosphoribosylamine--glycine ligase [Bacteroidia bacterium]